MFFFSLLSRLPLWFLYPLGELMVWLQLRLRPYRKAVVTENLRHSFSDKSEAERRVIMYKFYQNMIYLVIECIKALTLSRRALFRRVRCKQFHVIREQLAQHGTVFICTGHLANWEWVLAAGNMHLPVDGHVFAHHVPTQTQSSASTSSTMPQARQSSWISRLRKRVVAHIATHVRGERFGIKNYAVRDARNFFRHRGEKPTIYAIPGDQCPPKDSAVLWHTFFGRPAPFYQGVERLPRLLQAPVFCLNIERTRRGYYVVEPQLIASPPYTSYQKNHAPILHRYVEALEANIRQHPADWTWGHKRWKHPVPKDWEPRQENTVRVFKAADKRAGTVPDKYQDQPSDKTRP